jgi:hypothetical protein
MKKIFLLVFVTPILGLFRNYNKYRIFDFKMFLRTPFLVFIIYNLFIHYGYKGSDIFFLSLMIERWLLLFIKGSYSYYNNDFIKKKEKYKLKYGMKYN